MKSIACSGSKIYQFETTKAGTEVKNYGAVSAKLRQIDPIAYSESYMLKSGNVFCFG